MWESSPVTTALATAHVHSLSTSKSCPPPDHTRAPRTMKGPTEFASVWPRPHPTTHAHTRACACAHVIAGATRGRRALRNQPPSPDASSQCGGSARATSRRPGLRVGRGDGGAQGRRRRAASDLCDALIKEMPLFVMKDTRPPQCPS